MLPLRGSFGWMNGLNEYGLPAEYGVRGSSSADTMTRWRAECTTRWDGRGERRLVIGVGAEDVAQVSDSWFGYRVLIPAFMISEIRRGFEIGFLIVLPFLVIDLIVATITMAMGMMMLPPTVVSLPFKILFFVLIDGWNLLVGSLVRSFT